MSKEAIKPFSKRVQNIIDLINPNNLNKAFEGYKAWIQVESSTAKTYALRHIIAELLEKDILTEQHSKQSSIASIEKK